MPEEATKETQAAQTNCPACNKRIKKIKRYYRNSKFYCSKSCCKKFLAKQAKQEAK